ncbi:MAG: hypothetical protein KDA68_00980 [Planctomycetaceae bacterium]|nr:hypothetical protein [Planctomycetaceae bacterium]
MEKEPEPVNTRPSTSGLLWAEWRRGLKDLQNAVLNPWNGVTQSHEEPGTIATPTQAMVTRSMEVEVGPHLQEDQGYEAMFNAHAARGGLGREQQEKGKER